MTTISMFGKVLQGDLDPSARSLLQPEKIWGPLVSNISGGQEQGHSDQIGNMPKMVGDQIQHLDGLYFLINGNSTLQW